MRARREALSAGLLGLPRQRKIVKISRCARAAAPLRDGTAEPGKPLEAAKKAWRNNLGAAGEVALGLPTLADESDEAKLCAAVARSAALAVELDEVRSAKSAAERKQRELEQESADAYARALSLRNMARSADARAKAEAERAERRDEAAKRAQAELRKMRAELKKARAEARANADALERMRAERAAAAAAAAADEESSDDSSDEEPFALSAPPSPKRARAEEAAPVVPAVAEEDPDADVDDKVPVAPEQEAAAQTPADDSDESSSGSVEIIDVLTVDEQPPKLETVDEQPQKRRRSGGSRKFRELLALQFDHPGKAWM